MRIPDAAADRRTKAAAIADAIAKEPGRKDEILEENGTSQAEFEALLYTIAADPAQSRAFAAARAQ